jgi:hypothetical protein
MRRSDAGWERTDSRRIHAALRAPASPPSVALFWRERELGEIDGVPAPMPNWRQGPDETAAGGAAPVDHVSNVHENPRGLCVWEETSQLVPAPGGVVSARTSGAWSPRPARRALMMASPRWA